MKLSKMFASFARNEEGAVTVDWVVLTAGIAALGLAVAITVGSSTKELADNIASYVDDTDTMSF